MTTVLALLLFVATTIAALMTFTVAIMQVTKSQAELGRDRRAADGAIEFVISRIRNDPFVVLGAQTVPGGPESPCRGPATTYDVILPSTDAPNDQPRLINVECVAESSGPDHRIVRLSARADRLNVTARVKYVDDPKPGYRVVVCDWTLVDNPELIPCPVT